MSLLYVEGWAPEHGSPYEDDGLLADLDKVDEGVEVSSTWEPRTGTDDRTDVVAFVDGVLSIDSRLMLETDEGSVPGICGLFGVGAIYWNRCKPKFEIDHVRIERVAVRRSLSC